MNSRNNSAPSEHEIPRPVRDANPPMHAAPALVEPSPGILTGEPSPALPEVRLPKELMLRPQHVERGRAARALLATQSPGAAADEQILHDLIAGEIPVIAALEDAQTQIAARLALSVENPKTMVLLARVLRDVVAVSNSLSRRVEGSLAAAAGLRAQRRFLSLHRGEASGK